ncbi:MAG: hypothetical protein PVF34_10640, partial [Gammaproteobacteria bacterium]
RRPADYKSAALPTELRQLRVKGLFSAAPSGSGILRKLVPGRNDGMVIKHLIAGALVEFQNG